MAISLPRPEMQVDFALALIQLREACLQDAVFATVKELVVADVDRDLSHFARAEDLSLLASKGLRGEIVFAVPLLLRANPRVLGYYRLLQGFSQKAFYTTGTGLAPYKCMEERGRLPSALDVALPDVCRALNDSASHLLNSLSSPAINAALLDDLTLLTLGPQLRGGANVKKGAGGILLVFEAIREIVEDHIVKESPRAIEIRNAAGRTVLIEFAADPDIIIREKISDQSEDYRNIIAIEVKAGTDFSNIHNRLGEAEKSHQKAKQKGYTERWTVVNVERMDVALAKKESPSTDRFYLLPGITRGDGQEYEEFKNRIASLTGIPTIQRLSRRGQSKTEKRKQ